MTNTTAKTLIFSALPLFLLPLNAQAQIAADGTTSTTVTPTTTGVQIDNGDRSGGNLFHSFQNFSVPTNTEAYFNNVNDIANIFSRVTGGNLSNIDGLIRANGTANLFLINPNGIIFGENASLNIGGSFFATTADSISFEDNIAFSASDPTTPLLTSNIPIGANFRDNPGDIINRAGNIFQLSPGLTISSGEILTLLGGNVTFDGGQIIAPDGINVEIGGLVAEGRVTIKDDGSLNLPPEVNRGDITFTNQSIVASVPFSNPEQASGSININGKNINVQNISLLVAGATGISEDSNISEAGDITLNAQGGSIELFNYGGIISESGSNSTDDFAKIELTASQGSIFIANNSAISAANSSIEGLAGDIILNASNEINISDSNIGSRNTLLSNLIPNSANLGNGNNSRIFIGSHPSEEVTPPSKVNIQGTRSPEPENVQDPRSDSVFTTNISTTNFGRDNGEAGRIEIYASEEINISGSRLDSNTEIATLDRGNTETNEPETNENDETNNNFSTIKLQVIEENSEGTITLNQAEINNTNSNIGYAGDIILNAPNSIEISDSQLLADGRDGRILIGESETSGETFSSPNVTISDFSRLTTTNSYVTNESFQEETINAGDIAISASNNIELNNNSEVSAFTRRKGDAGDVTLKVNNGAITLNNSRIFSSVEDGQETVGQGDGGDISISSNSLLLNSDSQIQNLVRDTLNNGNENFNINPNPVRGNAGDINIIVNDEFHIIDGLINSEVQTTGDDYDAGNITINASSFILENKNKQNGRSNIISSNRGSGIAGDITLNISDSLTINDSIVKTDGNFGRIFIGTSLPSKSNSTQTIILEPTSLNRINISENSEISTTNSGTETFAGDIVLNASNSIQITDSKIVADGLQGFIGIGEFEIERSDGSFVQTSSPNKVTLNNSDLRTTNNAAFVYFRDVQVNSGDISIVANQDIELNNNSEISAFTSRTGNAGDVTLKADNGKINLNNSNIFSTVENGQQNASGEGNAGDIKITSNSLTLNDSQIQSLVREGDTENPTAGIGDAGDIEINVDGEVEIARALISSEVQRGNFDPATREYELRQASDNTGNEFGSIFIGAFLPNESNTLEFSGLKSIEISDSTITATNTSVDGFAGDIVFNASDSIKLTNSEVTADGKQGVIGIGEFNIDNGRLIQTSSPNTITFDGSALSTTNKSVDPNATEINEEGETVIATTNSGEIVINAVRDISLDKSRISAVTRRTGNAGNVTLRADNGAITLNNSDIFSNVENGLAADTENEQDGGGIGNAGDISIASNSLLLDNGSQIQSLVREGDADEPIAGQGDAGNITIDINEAITIIGEGEEIVINSEGEQESQIFPSLISSNVQTLENNFRAGNITINAGTLSIGEENTILNKPNEISSSTEGLGYAGDIIINSGGNVNIQNSNIETEGNFGRIFIGSVPEDRSDEGITAEVPSKVIIQGTRTERGDVNDLQTDNTFTTNVSTTNLGRDNGEAGRIEIQASEKINISGSRIASNTEIATLKRPESNENDIDENENSNNNFSQVILKVSEENSEGIITLDQAEINNTNSNIGFAGDIILNAPSSINISNSQLLADGRDGRILIGESEISGETFSPQNVAISDSASLSTTNESVNQNATEIDEEGNIVTDENGDPVIATINAGEISISANQDVLLGNGSRLTATTERKGNAGSIILNSQNLTIIGQSPEDPEIVVTSSIPDGNAGNIDITTNDLFQDGGEINADTQTEGANINLRIDNDWILRNESSVFANAKGGGDATAGNININKNLNNVEANINENSELLIFAFSSSPVGNDITARATGSNADGGQINLRAAGVFGIRERATQNTINALNDFNVSSEFGDEGIIEIDTFEDPSSSLVELPASVGDASDTISQNPCEQGVGSEFLVTGKGGFPANPQNNFNSNEVRVGLVEPVATGNQTATVEENNTISTKEPEVVPAQGWVFNDEGKVILTAHDPTQEGVQRNKDPLTGCPIP